MAIGLQQNAHGHIDHGTLGLASAQVFACTLTVSDQQTCAHAGSAWRPIMSRANW